MKIFVLIAFILMYVLIIAFPKLKPYITGGIALIITVTLLIGKNIVFIDVLNAIDYNVILMLFGIMLTVGYFAESNMPNKIADKLMSKIKNTLTAIILLSVISGIISAFIDNVATVLMLAPIGLAVSKKAKISPIPVIISIAVSSNLQGAATLVGDTTSVMLGGYAKMGFLEFFFFKDRFSIFWAVELGALATIPVLYFLFRKQKKPFSFIAEKIEVTTLVPSAMLLINILLLIVASFVPDKPEITNGVICTLIGLICLVYNQIKFKPNIFKSINGVVDFPTVLFLLFLFIVISCVDNVGIIDDISNFFVKIGADNIFLLYTVIVFGSVIISAFIDNIPYVATMLPVISSICTGIGAKDNISVLLYFGLLIGATLGGNLTPFGASANVVGIGILSKNGETVKNSDFLKIGVPFTLVAVIVGYVFCWLVWAI